MTLPWLASKQPSTKLLGTPAGCTRYAHGPIRPCLPGDRMTQCLDFVAPDPNLELHTRGLWTLGTTPVRTHGSAGSVLGDSFTYLEVIVARRTLDTLSVILSCRVWFTSFHVFCVGSVLHMPVTPASQHCVSAVWTVQLQVSLVHAAHLWLCWAGWVWVLLGLVPCGVAA